MGGVGGWAALMLLDDLESGSGELVDTAYRYGGSILHCGIIDLLVCTPSLFSSLREQSEIYILSQVCCPVPPVLLLLLPCLLASFLPR